jgi:hypothetical protein
VQQIIFKKNEEIELIPEFGFITAGIYIALNYQLEQQVFKSYSFKIFKSQLRNSQTKNIYPNFT